MCQFLEDHYVEDANGNFKVIYTPEKFRWAAGFPGYDKEAHLLIRSTKDKKLVGSSLSEFKWFMINGVKKKMGEGNFMCVHTKLRSKGMAA